MHALLLDEDRYLCPVRTMYRLLAAHRGVRERRDLRVHSVCACPEMLVCASNQFWSWEITTLKTTVKQTYLYLYVVLDGFGRYVVDWMLNTRESAVLARELVEQAVERESVPAGPLIFQGRMPRPLRVPDNVYNNPPRPPQAATHHHPSTRLTQLRPHVVPKH